MNYLSGALLGAILFASPVLAQPTVPPGTNQQPTTNDQDVPAPPPPEQGMGVTPVPVRSGHYVHRTHHRVMRHHVRRRRHHAMRGHHVTTHHG